MKRQTIFILLFICCIIWGAQAKLAWAEEETNPPATAGSEEAAAAAEQVAEKPAVEVKEETAPLSPATTADVPPAKPAVSLVIPNLTGENIGLETVYLASNSIREEAAQQKGYKLVDHAALFEKTQNNENREQLITLSKETAAEKAVLGTLKRKQQLTYLKLEIYNLKTEQTEKKLNTVIASPEPIAIRITCRGAIKELLAAKE